MSGGRAKAGAALAKIAAVSGALIDPPTLLPARTILELSGEAVRSRLCTFTDAMGEEFCLRPDMTTPIASQVAVGSIPAQRYHYSGSAYRLAAPGSNDAIEFAQMGFEWFGGGGVDEDAEALALALEAAKAGGAREVSLRVGDVALFRAVVDALGFSPRWTERLKRSFARRAGPKELLEQAADGLDAPSPLAAGLAALPAEDARRAVEEIFAIAGVQPVGGRGAAEIAERLCDRAAERAPDAGAAAKLIAYLDIEAPAGNALAALRAFTKDAGVDVAALDAFAERMDRIAALNPPFWKSATFSAEAGRRFEYYDGFVFDLGHANAPDRPIGGGGRYDGLVGRLSGNARSSGAIGAALRVDRLEADRT
ncbi:MAG: ATP phosphoribosyltransferase regulatory subunit [Alphaproteobacteria bacterium]|nr:ATP phosphoribosyltransferase regulatory subunit [Alphaproteobacteria bacterium]